MKNYIIKIQLFALKSEYNKLKKYQADDEKSKLKLEKTLETIAWKMILLQREVLNNLEEHISLCEKSI